MLRSWLYGSLKLDTPICFDCSCKSLKVTALELGGKVGKSMTMGVHERKKLHKLSNALEDARRCHTRLAQFCNYNACMHACINTYLHVRSP